MSKPLITIAENEALIALDVARGLEDAGFQVRIAPAPDVALRLAAIERPAGVVADVRLRKNGDGIDMVAALQKLCGPDLAVVFMSALEDEPTKARAARCHPVAYFGKPADAKTIARTLHAALASAHTPPGTPH